MYQRNGEQFGIQDSRENQQPRRRDMDDIWPLGQQLPQHPNGKSQRKQQSLGVIKWHAEAQYIHHLVRNGKLVNGMINAFTGELACTRQCEQSKVSIVTQKCSLH